MIKFEDNYFSVAKTGLILDSNEQKNAYLLWRCRFGFFRFRSFFAKDASHDHLFFFRFDDLLKNLKKVGFFFSLGVVHVSRE